VRRLEELPASDLIHPRIPKAPRLPKVDRAHKQSIIEEQRRDPVPTRRESGAPATRRGRAEARDGDAVGPGVRAKVKVSLAPSSGPVAPKVRTAAEDRRWASKAMGACAAIGLIGTVAMWLAR
jgi:hypothetical protein